MAPEFMTRRRRKRAAIPGKRVINRSFVTRGKQNPANRGMQQGVALLRARSANASNGARAVPPAGRETPGAG